MPLPKPALDTRSFAQLSDESRSLLPEVAPAWTDHNFSNTGIRLQELLAWLCEMDLYRLDRTTDEAIRGFLRLVGIEPRPVQVAQAVLSIDAVAEMDLPVGLQLQAPATGTDAAPVFQTTEAIALSKAKLVRVLSGDGRDVTADNAAGDAPYLPFGPDAAEDAALYLGFDAPLAAPDTMLNLYAWTTDPIVDAATRTRLIADEAADTRERAETCAATLREHPPWWLHYQVRTRWEYLAADGSWKALSDVVDHSRALCLSGYIRFAVPADHAAGGPEPGLFWIRCRVDTPGFECARRLAKIALNAVTVAHAADAVESLGRSFGRAIERYPLSIGPAIAGTTRLTVQAGSDVQNDWREVAYWDISGAHDRHYRLDRERGLVELGDGRRGVVATAAAQLQLRYRVGGDVVGNLPPRSLESWLDNAHNQALLPGWSALWSGLALQHAFASFGGAPAESLKSSVARAIDDTRTPSVALTLDDFERAARDVPGVPVARARAIADREPGLPCFQASGDITVVVVPDCGGPRPMPSDGMRAAVSRRLARRRSPATRVHVIGPSYYTVAVVAKLHATADADRSRLQADAIAALDVFLHPLRGGPDGLGWRIGRSVYRSEVLALLASLPGVASVTGLGLQGEADLEPRCANLPLCDEQLPAPGRHCIAVIAVPALSIIDRSHPHECP